MKKKLTALWLFGGLSLLGLTAYASGETETETLLGTEFFAETEDSAGTETESLSESQSSPETESEFLPETKTLDGTVSPEMQACRELLGNYFTVDLDYAQETLWLFDGAMKDDSEKAAEGMESKPEEGAVLSFDAPATSSVLEEIFEERYPAMTEELKEEIITNRRVIMNLKLAEEAGSDLVVLSQSLDQESVDEGGETSYSFEVVFQAGDEEMTANGTVAVIPDGEGGFTFTNFYIL